MVHCLCTPNMKGDKLVVHQSGKHLVPKERHGGWSKYPWGAHGEDGVALVRQFLAQRNFWPKDIMPVASLVPLAPARSQGEQHLWLRQQIIPRTMRQEFIPIRGVP